MTIPKKILVCLLIVVVLALGSCKRVIPSDKYMSRSDFIDLFHTNIEQFNKVGKLLDENYGYFAYQKSQNPPTDGLFVVNGEIVDAGRKPYLSDEEWAEINDLFQLYKWYGSETEEGYPITFFYEYPCKVRLITLDYVVLNEEGKVVFYRLIHASADDIGDPSTEAAAVEAALQRWRDLYGNEKSDDIIWTGEDAWYVNEHVVDNQ